MVMSCLGDWRNMAPCMLAACYIAFSLLNMFTYAYNFEADTELHNIAFHRNEVFIGAVNNIHRLNSNLVQLKSLEIGPVDDSRKCLPIDEICPSRKPTDNRNTVLLIYMQGSEARLLTCGSVFQGSCQVRDTKEMGVIFETYRAVSANDGNSSTVAFIAKDDRNATILNIGVTQHQRLQTLNMPSLSMRSLEGLVRKSFLKVFRKNSIQLSTSFEVDYVSGFSLNGYAYFTAVQRKGVDSQQYHSRIMRYCLLQVSEGLHTYTEIPLICKDAAGIKYNLLVAGKLLKAAGKTAQMFNVADGQHIYLGIFSKTAATGKAQTDKNAVCVFTLKDADKAFEDNINLCMHHGVPRDGGLPWLKSYDGVAGCAEAKREYQIQMAQQSSGDLDMSCSSLQLARQFPQGGSIAVNNTHLFVVPGKFTAMQAYPHKRGLALFFGSAEGMLLKYALFSGMKTHLYGQEVVEKNARIKKIEIGPQYLDLYALARRKVVKFSIQDCRKRATCIDCLAGPYCGWCTLENKCSMKSECSYSDRPLYFIADTVESCPAVVSFRPKPAAVSIRRQTKVYWTLKNMPTLQDGRKYSCSFGRSNVTADVAGNEFSCLTPKFGEVPGTDKAKTVSVKVSLRSPENDASLFQIDVDFFNCEMIQSCLECTRFKYTCNWCSSTLSCFDDTKSCPSPVPHAGPEQSINLSKCPFVNDIVPLYLSHGVAREIQVRGMNFPVTMGGLNYRCKISIDGNQVVTTAQRESETVLKCNKTTFNYLGNVANYTASVSFLFGGKMLDQIKEMKVVLYKCHIKRDGCAVCLDAPIWWKCGWCGKRSCTVADACPAVSEWTNGSCQQPPVIKKFSPSSGAIYGNTQLKIEGRDLGTTKGDIANITVAGQKCEFLPQLYVRSKTVFCKTTSVPEPRNGTVQMFVKFGAKLIQIDSKKLQWMYKKPIIQKFEPTKGPCSGGTMLTIYGTDLDVGVTVSVTVAGHPCNGNLRRFSNKIMCTISSSCPTRRRRSIDSVSVSFDGKSVPPTTGLVFSVQPDPEIKRVSTYKLRIDDSQALETFVSGGQIFIVKGDRFDLIQNPMIKFIVYPGTVTKYGPCNMITPSRLECVAPNVTEITGSLNNTSAVVQLGFLMQRIKSVEVFENITVRGDPVFEKFVGIKDLLRKNLFLKGKNLDLLGNEDVNVTVAGLPCVVQNIRETLFCISPDANELTKNKKDSKKALVKVTVGQGGLEYTLGYVRYVKSTPKEKPLPWLYIYIAAAVAAAFIIVIVILVILYRRRKKKEKKYQKVYQTRLENLESRYARECKEAFAELQTEMTDLTTDMSTSAIPYLRFENYAMRLLFPGIESHPVMEKDCNKSDSWKRCMSSLCELLKEKEFLLIFIKTLESQQSFAMRDRCKVASLLMVALQDDLKYVTDILQELLADLIHKSVDSGRTKLLLRRTESVAEKLLTNWLSYTLHEFLQLRVGEPLFRLFTAIGSLLDKEPVDVIACEARNSLSEDRLLRQKVDFKTITAHVEYDRGDIIQVQLLNCDSVNQAKEKILNAIYKNVPFSQRPNKDSLVLAYQTPTGGEKILHQEDSTCEIDGEWKRINTLDHFRIPDGCQLKLMPFSVFSDGTGTPGRFDVFHETSLPNVNFAPAHSSTPMLNNHHNNDDYKLWHLVKTSDYPMEQKEDVRQNKMMAEVYLTRLLKTKGTLQNFVDDLFTSVFSVSSKGLDIPPAMKFLFDFLDKQAALLSVADNEVLHTWKNNCLPLKFWINIVKNPNFVFDIQKTNIADSCLSVVAQLFMDSCSPEEHRLGKDSPSNKLLYAKEIPDYKKKVARFYSEVKSLPPATDKELVESLSQISDKYGDLFNHYNAGIEILSYAVKYKVKLMDALENEDLEEYAKKLQEIMENLPDD